MPTLYTIDPHRAFADALAHGLMDRNRDRQALARGLVLLPNDRAVRAVRDAFVRRMEGGLLLPRLVALGDADLGERIGGALDPADAEPVPPAIDPLDRQLRLARLIQRTAAAPPDAAEAMRLAADLGRVLDQLHAEGIAPARLAGLTVPQPLAAHWTAALARLAVLLDRWPDELAGLGRIDRADRRNRLYTALADRWRDDPPAGFVVAAGINVTAPAVARLLRRVAGLERGGVVLAGLDLAMPEAEWRALGPHDPDPVTGIRPRALENHPQYHLKLLLDRMGVARGEVRRWRWGGGHDAAARRSRAIANAMAPAAHTAKWNDLPAGERSLAGVGALVAETPAEEAQAIAIAMREALETPGRTVSLVTPDRMLAARVSQHLRRWGIDADDSAGRPLSTTPPGTLLLALAEAAAERFAPVALLALLKHPLVAAGEGRLAWLDGVRLLDRALRGPRPAPGLAGVDARLADRDDERLAKLHRAAAVHWPGLRRRLEGFEAGFRSATGLAGLVACLREAATGLAGDEAWARTAGRAAADLLADLEAGAAHGPRAEPDSLVTLLRHLMDGIAIRPPQGGHPRVAILGLIEARLQQADLVILGGLNEGVWPAPPPADPWLAPQVRAELGLPGLERRVGLAAHGFAEALGAPTVIVTRAGRDATAPTIASRFWLRLEAMAGGLADAGSHVALARMIDDPGPARPAARPAPRPPVAARPTRISVTAVDRLKADPFAFYAAAMLKLRPLDAIDAEPSAAWRGSAVHKVLEDWAATSYDPDTIRPLAEAMLARGDAHPLMRALWQPRLMEAIDFIAAQVAENRAGGRVPILSEAGGRAVFAGIELTGIADRLDRAADGGLVVVDYKTGTAPAPGQVAAGFALQLGLLGAIAEAGGFDGVSGAATGFEYWSFAKHNGAFGRVSGPVDDEGTRGRIPTHDFTRRARADFEAAAATWLTGDAPFTAKLHPEHAYADYDRLMRLDEWYGRDAG